MTKIFYVMIITLALALFVGNSYGHEHKMTNTLFCGYLSVAEYDIYRMIVTEHESNPKKDVELTDELLAKIMELPYIEENPDIFNGDTLVMIAFGHSKDIWRQAGALYYSKPFSEALKQERYKKCLLTLAGT